MSTAAAARRSFFVSPRRVAPLPLALQTRSPIPASLHLIHPPGIPQERGADGDYWGDDDELGGWSRFMGEGESGKSAALKKGKSRRDARSRRPDERVSDDTDIDDVGPIARRKPDATTKTAYKRGGPRPWEVARAAREAKADEDKARLGGRGSAGSSPDEPVNAFVRAGLPEHMTEAMRKAGMRRTTEIQRLAIPELVAGEDVVILAETGSGKTFAYTLPMVASVGSPGRGGTKVQGRCCPSMIVLVPNVELGRQVAYMAELASEWVDTGEYPCPSVFSLLGKDKKLLKPTAPKARGAAKTAAIKRKVQGEGHGQAARAARFAAARRRGDGPRRGYPRKRRRLRGRMPQTSRAAARPTRSNEAPRRDSPSRRAPRDRRSGAIRRSSPSFAARRFSWRPPRVCCR